MLNFKNISLHPRLSAFVEAFLGLFFIFWLRGIGVWWVLLFWGGSRLFTWALLSRFTHYPAPEKRWSHFVALTFFGAGFLSLLLFAEENYIWQVLALLFFALPAVSFWLIPADSAPSFAAKPYRRVRLLLTFLGLSGIWCGIFAIIFLQIFVVSLWWWLLPGAVMSALASWLWWKEYGVEDSRRFKYCLLLVSALFVEVGWALTKLPFGYFASGLLIMWLWYLLWLIARFHLSTAGVVWKKQMPILITSAVLLFIFLVFVARWK